MEYSVRELAEILESPFVGNGDLMITGVNQIDKACDGDLTFMGQKKYHQFLATTAATCILVPSDISEHPKEEQAYILVIDPYRAYIALMNEIKEQSTLRVGYRHPSSHIDLSASIAPTAYVSAGCFIGPNCHVGERVKLHPNVVLVENVRIGDNTEIMPNVTVYPSTTIGQSCLIHAGAVIGSDGFGYVANSDGSYEKIPHVGRTIIGNNVEIGANTTIDRGALSETTIGNGVKIDNLVHIAHNVEIGDNTAIAAQAGISGSTIIGQRVRIAGQVGLAGHLSLADDVTMLAQSGVGKSITKAGAYLGSPAKEYSHAVRIEGGLRMLPQLLKDVQELRHKLQILEQKV